MKCSILSIASLTLAGLAVISICSFAHSNDGLDIVKREIKPSDSRSVTLHKRAADNDEDAAEDEKPGRVPHPKPKSTTSRNPKTTTSRKPKTTTSSKPKPSTTEMPDETTTSRKPGPPDDGLQRAEAGIITIIEAKIAEWNVILERIGYIFRNNAKQARKIDKLLHDLVMRHIPSLNMVTKIGYNERLYPRRRINRLDLIQANM